MIMTRIAQEDEVKNSAGNAENMRNIAEEVLQFYESSIDTVSAMIDNTHQILEDYKIERNSSNKKLQEVLAKEKSLRKKDFDNIINEILPFQQEKEDYIKKSLDDFLKEQKKVAAVIKLKLSSNEKIRLDEFREMLCDIQINRNTRENEVRCMLKDFQDDYKRMGDSLRSILDQNKSIRVKDVKNMMKSFKQERAERKAEIIERARLWKETAKTLSKKRAERKLN